MLLRENVKPPCRLGNVRPVGAAIRNTTPTGAQIVQGLTEPGGRMGKLAFLVLLIVLATSCTDSSNATRVSPVYPEGWPLQVIVIPPNSRFITREEAEKLGISEGPAVSDHSSMGVRGKRFTVQFESKESLSSIVNHLEQCIKNTGQSFFVATKDEIGAVYVSQSRLFNISVSRHMPREDIYDMYVTKYDTPLPPFTKTMPSL